MLSLLPYTVQSGLERLRNVHRGMWQPSAGPTYQIDSSQRLQEVDSELEDGEISPSLPARRGNGNESLWNGRARLNRRQAAAGPRDRGSGGGGAVPYYSGESTPGSQTTEDVEVEYGMEEREMASLMENVRDALLVLDDTDRRPRSAGVVETGPYPARPRKDSGIKWDSVRRGLTKISVARDEKSQPPSSRNPSFERAEYIGGLRHLITSLPPDLSSAEVSTLRSSLPDSLTSSYTPSSPHSAHPSAGPNPSLLHRLVKTVVAAYLVIIGLLLPYILAAVHAAARAERKYHVASVLVSGALDMVRSAAKQVAAMSIVGDRTVGEAVASGVAWTVSGVAGGVADGLGEGLIIIQEKRRF